MTRDDLHQGLVRQLDEGRKYRDTLWHSYWEGRRMVTVPMDGTEIELTPTQAKTPVRLFPSFPNLAPKNESSVWDGKTIVDLHPIPMVDRGVIRDCIARLKAARAKESTNRNLSTLLAVVVKVQKDLETLVGDDWKQQDAAVESQVTRDDRSL